MNNLKQIFEYLQNKEKTIEGFRFDPSGRGGLVISMPGYKHMDLLETREELVTKFKVKMDFDKGIEEFDRISGLTFCYFKGVYSRPDEE